MRIWGEAASRFLTATAVVGMVAVSSLPFITRVMDPPHHEVLVVRDIDPGGMIGTYDMWWHRVADSGVIVAIDGECVSACALMLGIVPPSRVCLTDRATFGLHMASTTNSEGKRVLDKGVTEWMIRRYYPPIVKKWIEAHGGLVDDPIYMKPEDFKGYFRKCSKGEINPWPTEAPTS